MRQRECDHLSEAGENLSQAGFNAVLGGKHITSNASQVIWLLFEVTSKVTHLEFTRKYQLLFQISNTSYFVFSFIDCQVSCAHVERNQEYRGVVCAV